jgi:hypothetical protein
VSSEGGDRVAISRADLAESLAKVAIAALAGPWSAATEALKAGVGLAKKTLENREPIRELQVSVKRAILAWADAEKVRDVDQGLELAAQVIALYGSTRQESAKLLYDARRATNQVLARAASANYPQFKYMEYGTNVEDLYQVAELAIHETYAALYKQLMDKQALLPSIIVSLESLERIENEIIYLRDQVRELAGGATKVEPLRLLLARSDQYGNPPLVKDLDPYQLGAATTDAGDSSAYRSHDSVDRYVPRTAQAVDARLLELLVPGKMVLLVGQSTVGKTRTLFEAVKQKCPEARILDPRPEALPALIEHPAITGLKGLLVVWLDDLQRFLNSEHTEQALTTARRDALLARGGPTLFVATLRIEVRAELEDDRGELTRDTRLLLQDARDATLTLASTSADPAEQAAARAAYPHLDLAGYGLAEQLVGAPHLLDMYRRAGDSDSGLVLHSVIQTAIDWARVGMPGPLPESQLTTLARAVLMESRADLDPSDEQFTVAVAKARMQREGRVPALTTERLTDGTRGYLPFSYLIAADDGGTGTAPRPIPDAAWGSALERATASESFTVGSTAYRRGHLDIAERAYHRAADDGHIGAMYNLGVLAQDKTPPELDEACRWYESAAAEGHWAAAFNRGVIAAQEKPPNLEAAQSWWSRIDATTGLVPAPSEQELRGALDGLKRLALQEYGLSLLEILNADRPESDAYAQVQDSKDAMWRIGRLIGITVKQPFIYKVERGEEPSQTGARYVYRLNESVLTLERPELWQYRLIVKFLQTEPPTVKEGRWDNRDLEWLTRVPADFLQQTQTERGIYRALALGARRHITDKVVRALLATSPHPTVGPPDPGEYVTTSAAAVLVARIPWLDASALPVLAGFLTIMGMDPATRKPLSRFREGILPSPLTDEVET